MEGAWNDNRHAGRLKQNSSRRFCPYVAVGCSSGWTALINSIRRSRYLAIQTGGKVLLRSPNDNDLSFRTVVSAAISFQSSLTHPSTKSAALDAALAARKISFLSFFSALINHQQTIM